MTAAQLLLKQNSFYFNKLLFPTCSDIVYIYLFIYFLIN